jgi:phosphopantothenoylcysteine decarboxylase/phosphopantothenate--cysteine ligase
MTADTGKQHPAKIVIGVTGSIAAYKTAFLVSRLVQLGHEITVILTRAACNLVTPHTFQALTDRPVITDLWESMPATRMGHLAATDAADLFVVAPATANFIGKCSAGIADDALTTSVLACTAPVMIAPAMNPAMWANPIVQNNVKLLEGIGYVFVGPEKGRLAEGIVGIGRMSEPETLLDEIVRRLPSAPPSRP